MTGAVIARAGHVAERVGHCDDATEGVVLGPRRASLGRAVLDDPTVAVAHQLLDALADAGAVDRLHQQIARVVPPLRVVVVAAHRHREEPVGPVLVRDAAVPPEVLATEGLLADAMLLVVIEEPHDQSM